MNGKVSYNNMVGGRGLFQHSMSFLGRDSVVRIASRYGLGDPGIESRFGRDFPDPSDRPWGPPSLLYNRYWIFSPGVKRPGRDVDHPPPI